MMLVFRVLAGGLLLAHLAWLWFWLCGTLVLPPKPKRGVPASMLLDVMMASGAGIALTAFVSFGLGLLHLLSALGGAFAVLALVIAFALRGDPPWRVRFWSTRFAQLRMAASPGAMVVWLIALAIALPVILPDNGSDATAFYLPQALDYARSHALSVNTWYRFPWYPNNWLVILAWSYVFGAGRDVQFLNWLAGALTLLCVYGAVCSTLRPNTADEPAFSPIAVAAAVLLGVQAIFFRFVGLNMIDVPSGLLYLLAVCAATTAIRRRDRRTLGVVVVVGGCLVGSKISFVALLPLLFVLALLIAGYAPRPRRGAIAACAILLLLSAPWYARAWVLAGDPLTPLLNLQFAGRDPKWTEADYRAQTGDLRTDNTPMGLLRLPYTMFADPASRESRDVGVSLVIFCLPLPAIVLGWMMFDRRRAATPLGVSAVALVYAYAYWNLTSHLERYSLLFLPLLVTFIAVLGGRFARSSPTRVAVVTVALLLLAAPSKATVDDYYRYVWQIGYRDIGSLYTGENLWLEYRAPAYWQLEDLTHLLARAHVRNPRVYFYQLGGDEYFADLFGVQLIGDAFGRGRFADLGRAVQLDMLGPWLEQYGIYAVIAQQSQLDTDPVIPGLEIALHRLHWRKYRYRYSDWVVFVPSSLPRMTIGEGHPPGTGRPEPEPSPDPHLGRDQAERVLSVPMSAETSTSGSQTVRRRAMPATSAGSPS